MIPLKEFLATQRRRFTLQGVESPALSAELLLAATLGAERSALLKLLLLQPDLPLGPAERERFEALALRRLGGEPTAYILGEKEFYARPFRVNPAVLIPRPETELLIDTARELFKGRSRGRFADLGAGSGCIAVSLALELGPDWRGLALDVSGEALATARQNAAALDASAQLDFALADFNEYPFEPASLDLLASNPPYVGEAEYANLDPGVRAFEPKSALVPAGRAAAAGDEDLKNIAALAASALKSGGCLLMEMGCAQGPALRARFSGWNAWSEFRIIKDAAGLDRLVYARRR